MDVQDQRPEFLRLLFSTVMGTTRAIELDFDEIDDVLQNGVFFDGSSVPGYANVNSSDLKLRPAYDEPIILPWEKEIAILPCSVYDTDDKPHPADTRNALRKAVWRAHESGYDLRIGCELEFFLVRKIGNGDIVPHDRGGYFSTLPEDGALEFRREVIRTLRSIGIATTTHHHEVAPGQHEFGLRFGPVETIAEHAFLARIVVMKLAHSHGMIATFMPKPFTGMNGSGMHLHQSIWDIDEEMNLFAGEEPGGLSTFAGHYVAGLIEHAPALVALVAPTVNSFKRLRPGYEAPTKIAWGPRNRTTMIRVPQFNGSESKARIEFRCPDPSCDPFLAMAAILAAGLDGIDCSLVPPAPTTEDLFESDSEVTSLPGSLSEALSELKKNSVIRSALGDRLVDTVLSLRLKEWEEYYESGEDQTIVTSWEIEKYLYAS